jgi:formimidoylglutamate deiminase
MPTLYLPDLLYTGGAFRAGVGLLVHDAGSILRIGADLPETGHTVVRMQGKAILPGQVNAHSHTFQRLIRGAAEHCGPQGDDFWAWRNKMYAAASKLDPHDMFDVARMAFLEMAIAGVTAVGEFHYVHRQQDGTPYEDPNLLAKAIIRAAESVGLRICLLRAAYARAGYELPFNRGQKRFYETCDEYLDSVARLAEDLSDKSPIVSMGVAPHSIRAVPLVSIERIAAWAAERGLPIHLHIAEQQAEIAASKREYGASPIQLLAQRNLLSDHMTLVHAIHTSKAEVEAIAEANAIICSCPTTERNLGDGIIAAEEPIARGVLFSFGSDSQANINLLEDARELDYHLRLKRERRVLLDNIDGEDMSARLFRYATEGGARSLGMETGALKPGCPADFFSIDLHDVSIAGASPEELMPTVLFALERTGICDVAVNGRMIVSDRRHPLAREIVSRYEDLVRRAT